MNALFIKTPAEQKLEWFSGLHRPLTDEESAELQRSLHAKYVHDWRLARLARTEREASAAALLEHSRREAETLRRVSAEAEDDVEMLRERLGR